MIKKISIFEQFGFKISTKSGNQSIGNCPFCGDADHFYVNLDVENKPWDCKKCLRSGGYKTFIKQIVEYTGMQFTKSIGLHLSKNRSINFDTLKFANIGYHPLTKKYIIPAFSEAKTILYIKLFNFESMIMGTGCNASFYGLNFINLEKCKLIYICEGEWDTLALLEIIRELELTNIGVIGVPGAGTFKTDMLQIFDKKNVVLLYDNDKAGNAGIKKVTSILQPIVTKLYKIYWNEKFDDGYDVRDLRTEYGIERAYNYITNNMTEIKDESIMQVNEAYNKPPIDSNDVYSVFKKWLYLPSVSIIDVIFGTILANRIPGDPVWLFLVAPPGGGKSEPLRALTDCPGIKVLSTLTPHTLISGMGREDGKDASLIPLLNNNVLIIKDFTPILNMPLVNRDEILSILRDAFDGECAKPFGNGVWKKYKSVFGIIAAVTPVIEAFTEESASVGERFLRWKNDIPLSFKLRTKYVEKAYENLTHEKEMRDELHKITERVLQSNYSIIPELPSAMQSKITKLSLLLEVLRSCVVRDRYTKDILHMPFVGVATRLSKELIKLAYGISQFKQLEVVSIDVYKILVHVVKSSVTKRSIDLLKVIYKNNGKLSLSDCKNYTKLPTITCQLIFDNFVVLNIVKKEVNDNKISYKLMPDINDIIKSCQLFD